LGDDVSPTLDIKGMPKEAQSLVLIVDDPDAPVGTWVHWVVYDIPVIAVIKEGSVPGTQGINNFNKINYGGPCPPSGTHRYFFKLFALDTKLNLPPGKTKAQIEKAMDGHILGKDELIGLFKR
jgi:Raf kinase inhibitor-like YbhB/YbcL family protein